MDKKTLRNDLILIGSLLLVAVTALIIVSNLSRPKTYGYANVRVQNEAAFAINLGENEEKDYPVYALNSDKLLLTIRRIDHGVRVISSTCPHKDCIQTGYVNTLNRPIICAYNQVSVVIAGTPEGEVR